jgi:hypothetical protein
MQMRKQFTSETIFYRGRISNDYDSQHKISKLPQQELGPPPNRLAGSQRMTPQGIAAMYCAFEPATCISEIRAIAGDTVAVGAFRPTNTIDVIDLSELESAIIICSSEFEAGHRKKVHARAFVRRLVEKISKPKGGQDELGYISTQAFFEYLRLGFGPNVDGLCYPSVQTARKGRNIVFFPTPCLVVETKIDPAHTNWNAINFNRVNKLEYIKDSLEFFKVNGISTIFSKVTAPK